MTDNDYVYFHGRAEAELRLARQATHAKAIAAHQGLAKAYLQRASSLVVGNATERRAA